MVQGSRLLENEYAFCIRLIQLRITICRQGCSLQIGEFQVIMCLFIEMIHARNVNVEHETSVKTALAQLMRR